MIANHKEKLKRNVKAMHNFMRDPLPRHHRLVVVAPVVDDQCISLHYRALDKHYCVRVTLPDELLARLRSLPESEVSPLLQPLSMAFAPVFFKLTDFAGIDIGYGEIGPATRDFYARYIQAGLGQFRYLQGLDPTRPIEIDGPISDVSQAAPIVTQDHVLMMNGGGKDTIVAGELLKRAGISFTWVSIRPKPAQRAVVSLSGNTSHIDVGFTLDPAIEVDKRYPWGHFPHTSIVSAVGTLLAYLCGYRYVALGNESSANEGNLVYKGFEVNHQYTKSLEFERGWMDYTHREISADLHPFSILRPFHDLQLAKFFCEFADYHQAFISCNRAIARNAWCLECPKCAFMVLALAPFLDSRALESIFRGQVFQSNLLAKEVSQLVDRHTKPWDCVGTKDENRLALKLGLARHPDMFVKTSPNATAMLNLLGDLPEAGLHDRILNQTIEDHLVPAQLIERLQSACDMLGWPRIAPNAQPGRAG